MTPYQQGYKTGLSGNGKPNPYSRYSNWQRWLKWNQGYRKGKKDRREEQR